MSDDRDNTVGMVGVAAAAQHPLLQHAAETAPASLLLVLIVLSMKREDMVLEEGSMPGCVFMCVKKKKGTRKAPQHTRHKCERR